ncbi:hypothetical protein [Govanella unica]|uniref:Uncharacterized protein n=1 Tax=Govanella unica TaxID=2975056 RepID=A0A9X3Z853_9PROT|nr:hypothetical protein [Govania unica]MDA5194985.1 hypothetical protein [Govania unica]
MKKWKVIVLVSFCSFTLSGCGYSEDVAEIYVLVPSQKTSQFTEDLGKVAKEQGLAPSLGQATDDYGHTIYVIEAKGKFLRLWGTNMPLDPSKCGTYEVDPGQYVITIDHSFPIGGLIPILPKTWRTKPQKLLSEIGKQLGETGYAVQSKAMACSPVLQERLRQEAK